MSKMQKFVESKTWLWYEAGITEEQEKEYLAWENDETGRERSQNGYGI